MFIGRNQTASENIPESYGISARPYKDPQPGADCGTCLGQLAKDAAVSSLPLNRGEMESTTCPEAARWPFPSARLWAKLITAGEHKELPLSPARSSISIQQVRPARASSPIHFFGRKYCQYSGFGFFPPLLVVTCLSFKPAPHLLKAPPFLRLVAPYHGIPSGLQ